MTKSASTKFLLTRHGIDQQTFKIQNGIIEKIENDQAKDKFISHGHNHVLQMI